MKFTRLMICCAALLCLSGCFDYLEEIWINPDGSGRLKVDMGLSEAFVSLGKGMGDGDTSQDVQKQYLKTKQELEHLPNVRKVDLTEYSEGGMHHFVFDIDVKDISRIGELTKKLEMSQLQSSGKEDTTGKSDLHITRLPNGNIQFLQVFKESGNGAKDSVSASGDSSAAGSDSLDQAMAASMFGTNGVTVRLHSPKILSSNGKIDDAMKTVEWKIPLVEMSRRGFHRELKAEIEVGQSRTLLLTIIIGGAFLLLLAGFMVVRMRAKPPQPL